ncbi:hypothetical protein K0M31_020197 [Melipona bicolor]|uniref:Uncharacterized protein n=1 Tax=Melipona bicolor TaxID=60889 RepID=A0AA40G101_9HYME|nr:hypothetical protein K0M31_020197 [Melipona bicolor]
MFGITDAHAEDSTRGEENPVYKSKMSSTYTQEKRPASPGLAQPTTKHQKLDQKFNSSRASSYNDSNVHFKQSQEIINNERNFNYSDNQEINVENTRLCKSYTNTNIEGHQTDNIGNIRLKELRIILEDIKHINIKYDNKKRMKKLPTLWEVEKILAKKVVRGVPTYLIKWKNWNSEYNTWEPISNLVNCADILEKFEKNILQLINRFKKKAKFYPTDSDIEKFINSLNRRGETLTSLEINTIDINIRKYFRQRGMNNKLGQIIKRDILRTLIIDLRKKQLQSLKEWETEINIITKDKPIIQVENVVDLESAPQDFYYIEDYLPGNGVIIPDDPPIGCECKTCNSKTNCCFAHDNGSCPYTLTYKVRVPPGTPIYECNKRCNCDINCFNRVVQRGSEMKFCIFRTANGRGWGVKTLKSIKKGCFVTQYVGEVITNEEAEKRGKEYDAAGRTYLFDLDYNEIEGECPYTVDAAVYGNISHFINHSCDPNLAVYGVWIDCLDPNLPKLALFATRDIKQNEEITFDYMCQSSKNSENSIKQNMSMKDNFDIYMNIKFQEKLELRPDTPESDLSNNKTLCKCGAQNCRRYLF